MHIKLIPTQRHDQTLLQVPPQTSTEQVAALEKQLRLCRWTYNALLEHSLAGLGTPTHKALTYILPEMKAMKPELYNVFSQVLNNVAKRVHSGFGGYWARRRG